VQRVRKRVGTFREIRHLLVGDFYPLTAQPARPEEGEAVQFVSRDGSVMAIFAFAGTQAIETLRVRPRAIAPTASYERHDPLLETRSRVAGSSIVADGLAIPLPAGAALVRLSRIAS
jgi:hypothetical protein